MNRRRNRLSGSSVRVASTALLLLVFPIGFMSLVPPAHGDPPTKVRIGIVRSFFREVPESRIGALMPPFQRLMQDQTGLPSELAKPTDAEDLAEELTKDKIELGIFQGVEFAWARQKHPELRPLVIAVNQHRNRRAHLMVRQDSAATTFAGLEGKVLAIPSRTREHCHLFVQGQCQKLDREPAKFFARIATPANIEEALDDVVDGTVQAAVVDGVGLEAYKRRKPGRFAKLKELLKSELFPDTVVAYHRGALDDATLERFRSGLMRADKTATGRLLLMLWTLTAFEAVPQDYEQMLSDIAKAYPALSGEARNKGARKKESDRPRPKQPSGTGHYQ